MKHKLLFTAGAIVCIVFGLAFLLIPAQAMEGYGIQLDLRSSFITRYWGSAFIGTGTILWLARMSRPESSAVRAIIIGMFVVNLTGFVVSLTDALWGGVNYMGWTTVALYGIFAIWFGYFVFKKMPELTA